MRRCVSVPYPFCSATSDNAEAMVSFCPPIPAQQERGTEAQQPSTAVQADALGLDVKYVSSGTAEEIQGTEFAALSDVLSKFASPEELTGSAQPADGSAADGGKGPVEDGTQSSHMEDPEQDSDAGGEEDDLSALSNRKRKQLLRMSVAELKAYVDHPHVVEAHDVTSHEPKLLVALKAARNTVPVPQHWSQKRKYLQGKRGFDKSPYELPAHIAATGIGIIRDASLEKDAGKSLKQRMRERVRPKRGQMEIEYEKLYDAFFRHAVAPRTTTFGDMYYENKEMEHKYSDKRPGVMSDRLREALGISGDTTPPPWLINMQRFGPPPSYTNLSVPGLNAPLPEGCSYGFQPGGWGKPPVNAAGEALYGDPFGLQASEGGEGEAQTSTAITGSGQLPVQKEAWGGLQEVESESEEEEEEEGEGEEGGDAEQNVPEGVPGIGQGQAGADDDSSTVLDGTVTPAMVQLRKDGPKPATAYTVLQAKQASFGDGIVGASHTYEIPPDATPVNLSKGGGLADTTLPTGAASVGGLASASTAGGTASVSRGTKRSRFSSGVETEDVETATAKKYKDFKF